MKKIRENNYELLRIICAIAVISIHVCASKIVSSNDGNLHYIFNALSRFAVPCFIMISGAFILGNNKNQDYKYFYKKSFKKIGVFTIIFTFFYFLLKLYYFFKYSTDSISSIFLETIKGKPFYHMWYLYMLIGIYLITPIIIKFKNDIGEEKFAKVAVLFFIIACISGWTSTHKLSWDIGYSFCYLGYYMIGYVIRKRSYANKSNLKAILYIILSIIPVLTPIYLGYLSLAYGYIDNKYFDPFYPCIVIYSVLIFKGFSMMNINKNFEKISSLTFLIYLIHVAVLEIGKISIFEWLLDNPDKIGYLKVLNSAFCIPILVTILFIISIFLSIIYRYCWNFFERKFDISEKMYNGISKIFSLNLYK